MIFPASPARVGAIAASLLFVWVLTAFPEAAAQQSPARIDSAALTAWSDRTFQTALEERRISGAAVGVVKGGETLLLEGYGWQDPVQGIPLDPEKTVLRVCSLSKSFTAVSVLQLIDRGLIEGLDVLVNHHLDRFKLPAPWGDEVTLKQLMTHSSGMTGGGAPQGSSDYIAVPVGREELARLFQENLVRQPGQISLYANLGVAVEGMLIEDVSGLPLAEYMQTNIFRPLGMSGALLHHSMETPENLAIPAAVFPNGEWQPLDFFPKHPAAAASGGVMATPTDMLRYVAFHASDTLANSRVLDPKLKAAMRNVHFRDHDLLDGVGLHLYPETYGSYEIARHSCNLPGFKSHMAIIPELEMGIYFTLLSEPAMPSLEDVAALLADRGRFVSSGRAPVAAPLTNSHLVFASFMDAFFPARELPALPDLPYRGTQSVATKDLTGTYWTERRPLTSLGKILYAMETREVFARGDERVSVDDVDYEMVANGVFARIPDGNRRVMFKRLENGRVYLVHDSSRQSAVWRRVSGAEDPRLWAGLFAGSLVLLFTGLLAPCWRDKTVGRVRPSLWGFTAGLFAFALLLPVIAGSRTLGDMVIEYLNNDFLRISFFVLILHCVLFAGLGLICKTLAWWLALPRPVSAAGRLSLFHAISLCLAILALFASMLFYNLVGLQLY